jgi:hypothetical protein
MTQRSHIDDPHEAPSVRSVAPTEPAVEVLGGKGFVMAVWATDTPSHTIVLEHGWLSGRVRLFVAATMIFDRPGSRDYPGQIKHEFDIDDQRFVLRIKDRSHDIGFDYELRLDDRIIAALPRKTAAKYIKALNQTLG